MNKKFREFDMCLATPTLPKITAVISFCSNDWRFLKRCIQSLSFCDEILVTVCDHFFDGSEENYTLLEKAFSSFSHCKFIEFAFDPQISFRPFSNLFPGHADWRHEWHNAGRWLGFLYSAPQTEYLLFLDCDEIVESQAFVSWLNNADLTSHPAYRFAGLWHFREARYEANCQDDLSLLVHKGSLHSDYLWDEDERSGLNCQLKGIKNVKGLNGDPMIRHYSCVRPKEELIKKFSAWGHHWERDWQALVDEEFSRPFNGKDFIRGYSYKEIEPHFDPFAEEIPTPKPISFQEHLKNLHLFPNVIRVNKADAFRKELEHALSDHNCHQFLQ